jgi:hypothetical protein
MDSRSSAAPDVLLAMVLTTTIELITQGRSSINGTIDANRVGTQTTKLTSRKQVPRHHAGRLVFNGQPSWAKTDVDPVAIALAPLVFRRPLNVALGNTEAQQELRYCGRVVLNVF